VKSFGVPNARLADLRNAEKMIIKQKKKDAVAVCVGLGDDGYQNVNVETILTNLFFRPGKVDDKSSPAVFGQM
jgi:hypothetical protein